MLAFVAAVDVEITGRMHPSSLDQFHSVGGVAAFLFVSVGLTVATFMPEIKRVVDADYQNAVGGYTYTSDPASREAIGPFTAAAEMMNGRAAMMGLVSLMLVESLTHQALF